MNHHILRAALAAFVLVLAGTLAPAPLRAEVIATDDSKAPPPEIGGPSTREMAGLTIHYLYSTGREYQLSFDADTVTFLPFKMPGDAPDTKYQPGTLHYRRPSRPPAALHGALAGAAAEHGQHPRRAAGRSQGAPRARLGADARRQEFFDIADIQTITWKKPAGEQHARGAVLLFILLTVALDSMGMGILSPVTPKLILELSGAGLAQAAIFGGWLTAAFAGCSSSPVRCSAR